MFLYVFTEPPKQKRKKTLELFDDKDDEGDLFNDDKRPTAKSVTEPKKAEKKVPVEDTGGLFAASDKEKIESEVFSCKIPVYRSQYSKLSILCLQVLFVCDCFGFD